MKTSKKQDDKPLLVRLFTARDAKAVSRLVNPQKWPPPPKALKGWEKRENDPDFSRLYVAELDGQVVGKIGVECSFPPYGEFQNLIVAPEFRRKGIGSYMIRWCESLALEHDLSVIHLQTQPDNQAACALYEKGDYLPAIPPRKNLMVFFHFLRLSVLNYFLNAHPSEEYCPSDVPFFVSGLKYYELRWEDTTLDDVLILYAAGGPSGIDEEKDMKPMIIGGRLVESCRNIEILMLPGLVDRLSFAARQQEELQTLTPGKAFWVSLVYS